MPADTLAAVAGIIAVFAVFMATVAFIDSRFWRSDERDQA